MKVDLCIWDKLTRVVIFLLFVPDKSAQALETRIE